MLEAPGGGGAEETSKSLYYSVGFYRFLYNLNYNMTRVLWRGGSGGAGLLRRYLGVLNRLKLGDWRVVEFNPHSGRSLVRGGSRRGYSLHMGPFGSKYKLKNLPEYPDAIFAGSWAALIYTATGVRVRCTELKCVTAGDPYCEFITEPE